MVLGKEMVVGHGVREEIVGHGVREGNGSRSWC